MILKTSIILTFNFIWLNSVSGASFSKVFVHSGAEVVPVDYVQYGVPAASVTGSQIAQISTAPGESVVPLPATPNYLAPCGTPCVYPGLSVAAIQAAVPNYVTYKSSVPVVVEPTGYEYSYVVYDENTGDHKSQSEHSDGSVVRGEYSLIQPDGYMRKVQYVADDLKGFNAVVKNFLPVNVETKIEHTEKKDQNEPPCPEVKNESLKHTSHHEDKSSDKSKEKFNEESKENSSVESGEKSSEKVRGYKSSKESNESQAEKSNEHMQAEKSSEENLREKPSAAFTASEIHEAKSEEEHKNVAYKGHAEPVSSEELKTEHSKDNKESQEEHKEDSHEHKESHESREEPSHEMHKESHESHELSAHEARSGNHDPEGNLLVSYNDVIKCVQSAIRKSNDVTDPHQAESPLTYIILNQPC